MENPSTKTEKVSHETLITCKEKHGEHAWKQSDIEAIDVCVFCGTRRDVWMNDVAHEQGNKILTGNKEIIRGPNGKLMKGTASLNPDGRPVGSRSLTSIVRNALRQPLKAKDPFTGEDIIISGEELFSVMVLENALKKGDREAQRMIWEHLEGKPTQQHRLDIHSPKGYQVDPEREKVITEQFGMYDDQIPMLATPLIAPQTIKEVETVQTTETQQNTPPTPQNTPNQGVQEPPITYDNTQQNNTGVRENTEGQTGGVREA